MFLVEFWFINSIFLIFLVFTVVYAWCRYKLTYWQRRGVRSPPSHWFFGHVKDAVLIRAATGIVMGRVHLQASEKDDVLGFYIFQRPALLLINSELIKQILVKDFHLFSNRHFAARGTKDIISSKNLFSINNPEWKHLRTKISPVFSSSKLKNLFQLMLESADTMSNYLNEQFKDDSYKKSVLVRDTMKRYTTDVISSLAFGIRTNSFDPKSEFHIKARTAFPQNLLTDATLFILFFFPEIFNHFGRQFFGPARDYFTKLFWNSFNTRMASGMKRGDIIDTLIDLKNEKSDDKIKFEGDYLVAQSGIFFIAGLETSATTVSFTLGELAKHPEIQKRVREEILSVLKEEGFTYEAVQKMKYLSQVVSETLRLYPPAPIIDREALVDYKIPNTDIVIEKGTAVYVALCGLHLDPKYFPNPTRFDPDRFSEENKQDIIPFTYMPFGEGQRMCIGMRVGLLQASVGLVTILSQYEVSLSPQKPEVKVHPYALFLAPESDSMLDFKKLT